MTNQRDGEEVTFGKWLQAYFANVFIGKYLAKNGKIPSQNDFARWLEIEPYNVSQYMNDNRRPDAGRADALASKLGPQVYDLLGMPRKMPKDRLLYYIADHWHELTPEEQKEILERAKNAIEKKKGGGDQNRETAFA